MALKFAPRVKVWSEAGGYLFRTHAAHAQQLCHAKIARPDVAVLAGKRVWRVWLRASFLSALRVGPPSEGSLKDYSPNCTTKAFVVFQVLGYHPSRPQQRLAAYTFQFNRVDEGLRAIVARPQLWERRFNKEVGGGK